MVEPSPRSSDPPRPSTPEAAQAGVQTTIFVTDPSADAERAAQALRALGYLVFDVPLSQLVGRVAVQRPGLVILDVDAEDARECVARMREAPGSEGVEVLFVGDPGRTLRDATDAAMAGASGFFPRPLDVTAMVRTVEVLSPLEVGDSDMRAPWSSIPPAPVSERERTGVGVHPSTLPPGPMPLSSLEPPTSSTPPARSSPLSAGPPSMAPPSLLDSSFDPTTWGMAAQPSVGTQLSDELQRVLATAEERVGASAPMSSQPPSPEDEVDAVLPADLLAALDEPLDFDDDDEGSGGGLWQGTPSRGRTTGLRKSGTGTAAGRTSAPEPDGPPSLDERGGTSTREQERSPGTRVDGERGPPSPMRASFVEQFPPPSPIHDSALDQRELDDENERVTPRPARGNWAPEADASTRAGGDVAERGALVELSLRLPLRGEGPGERGGDAGERGDRPGGDDDDSPPTRGDRGPFARPVAERLELTPRPPTPAPEPSFSGREFPTGNGRLDDPRAPTSEPGSSAGSPPTRPGLAAFEGARAVVPVVPEAPVREAEALGEGDAVRLLAAAIAERYTGSLCFDGGGGLRRVVLRDGDLVTAGSSLDQETLVAYLVARGELPRDVAARLSGRLPPFGRHAGAALIAHGHLGQDRLWEVLRGHAEWLVSRVLQMSAGTCAYEHEAPGRLRAEPSVFGGSTGAEVLVEVVRRVISPAAAVQRLGGSRARLGDGRRRQLLGECALSSREVELVERSRGFTVAETLEAARSPDFAAVLMALLMLGVVETLASSEGASQAPPPMRDALDDEALRARVRARLDLVEEGDYFAVLGVARAATPYEIKRAYLELRRSFEPSRVLTAATADVGPSLGLILEVLDEAYEVLRDATRRERYRRAIEAGPPAP
jgi:hypothetical protein